MKNLGASISQENKGSQDYPDSIKVFFKKFLFFVAFSSIICMLIY